MLVTCVISVSEGTRRPVLAWSVRPVSSFTHSRITEGALASSAGSSRAAGLGAGGGFLAVVTTSSFCCDASGVCEPSPEPSGNARLDLLGARREPMRGARYRFEKQTSDGEKRYVLRPAMSER